MQLERFNHCHRSLWPWQKMPVNHLRHHSCQPSNCAFFKKVLFSSCRLRYFSIHFQVIFLLWSFLWLYTPTILGKELRRPWGRESMDVGNLSFGVGKLGGGSRLFQTTWQRIEDEYAFYETCCDMIRFGWIWWNRSNSCFEVMWNRISHDLTDAMISLFW